VTFDVVRPARRILATAAVLAMLIVLVSALPAAAGGALSEPVGLVPANGSSGNAGPYFVLSLAPGQSVTPIAFISNPGQATRELRISRSTGGTAANGGTTFTQAFRDCSGVGCWVTGLPATVTLPPRTGERLQFRVSVPRGTAPGQYLAGITAEVAAPPSPAKVVSGGNATGKVIIIEQVTVAVAVTVGRLSTLTTRLNIPTVQGGAVGQLHRLEITVDNTGRTFTHGTGTASCVSGGQTHTYAVYADTVLPGGQAVIPVNASALPGGTPIPCTVKIHYGDGKAVTWTGRVVLPSPPQVRIVHTGPGAYSVLPDQGIPAWAIALMAIGACVLAGLVVLLYRNRRRTTAGQQE
jgi:hypothetical protein